MHILEQGQSSWKYFLCLAYFLQSNPPNWYHACLCSERSFRFESKLIQLPVARWSEYWRQKEIIFVQSSFDQRINWKTSCKKRKYDLAQIFLDLKKHPVNEAFGKVHFIKTNKKYQDFVFRKMISSTELGNSKVQR